MTVDKYADSYYKIFALRTNVFWWLTQQIEFVIIGIITFLFNKAQQEFSYLFRDATEKVVSLVSQGVKYVQKCSLIIKYC